MRSRTLLVAAIAIVVPLAGCIGQPGSDPSGPETGVDPTDASIPGVVEPTVTDALAFNASVVEPAVGAVEGIFDPTVEVAASGTIYVAVRGQGVRTVPVPAYVSRDDGGSWEQLPALGSAQAPSSGPATQPTSGDVGTIAVGEDGRAWMVSRAYDRLPLTGWCGDGTEQCYWHPDAYSRAEETATVVTQDCSLRDVLYPLPERPWAAYANGTLLLVNKPGAGPVQVGAMEVPHERPVEVAPPEWNYCASGLSISEPGVPALRDDGRFVVPHVLERKLHAVTGDVEAIQETEVHEVFGGVGGTDGAEYGYPDNGGVAAFDAEGTLYMGALTGTEAAENITFAVSEDGGRSFTTRTVDMNAKVGFFHMDGNPRGPGALATWTQNGNGSATADFYAGHLSLGPDGGPVLSDVTLVADEVENPRFRIQGAAVGPDGRAYLAVTTYPGLHPLETAFNPSTVTGYPGAVAEYAGSNPLSVYIQQDGPVLPTGS